jgi:tight adherence protein C
MRIEQIALLALLFVIVFAAALKMMSLLRPDPLRHRINGIGREAEAQTDNQQPAQTDHARAEGGWTEKVVRMSTRVAKLSLPSENFSKSVLRVRFLNAGFRSESAPSVYFGAKTVLALALPVLALLALSGQLSGMPPLYLLFVLLAAATFGFYLPNVVLSRLVERRKLAIFEDIPDAVDLMTVCVEAGLGFDAALARVTNEIGLKSRALCSEFELVLLELRAGSGRDKALRNLALRTGVEDIDTLTTMLIQADRFGTSVGDSLRVYTDNLRTKRRLRAEERAAKISLKLLFPLVFFIFPSLIIVLIGPAVLQAARILIPSMKHISG